MNKTIMLDVPSFHCLYFSVSNGADNLREEAEKLKKRTGLYEVEIIDETSYQQLNDQANTLKVIASKMYEDTNKQIQKAQKGKGRQYYLELTDVEIKHILPVIKQLSDSDKDKETASQVIDRLQNLI